MPFCLGQNNAPTCTSGLFSKQVPESSAVGYAVIKLSDDCSDVDAGADGVLNYVITSGDDDGDFAINGASGEITLVNQLDYENFVFPTFNVSSHTSF